MSTLDKSLDQIIASNRSAKSLGRVKSKGKGVGKPRAKLAQSKPASAKLNPKTIAKIAAKTVDLAYATKVLCYNLPRDLKKENVMVCCFRSPAVFALS